jgi:uncharacterized protein YutE (UPF0331/DUF86 family)
MSRPEAGPAKYTIPRDGIVARSVGLRNILVHEYNAVDVAQVHTSIRECLQDYERYVAYVTAFLDKLSDSQDA